MLQGGKRFSRKVAEFLKSTGVRQWLFLRGESAHAERTPSPWAGRVPRRGGVGPRGRTARPALGHLAASPPLLHSSCPSRCSGTTEPASRARIRCPIPVSSEAARFLSPAAAGLEARGGPRERPLHVTSLPGRPFPILGTAHPKARRCEQVVCAGDFTTCTEIIFGGGERTVS